MSLGNLTKDHQRFVDTFVSVFAYDWFNRLSNFENVAEAPFEPAFEHRIMIGFAKLIRDVMMPISGRSEV